MSSSANLPSNSLHSHGQLRGVTPIPSQPTCGQAATGPMHPAGPQPVPVKSEALQKAIQQYVSKLSNDDKEAFRVAPNVIERLQEIQQNSKSHISSSYVNRVERVLQCIKYFMGSLGIFIQQNPDISSLVVGGVNCILTVGPSNACFFSLPSLSINTICIREYPSRAED